MRRRLPAGTGLSSIRGVARAGRGRRVKPETRYARSGDVSIAYQVSGEGTLDVVLVPGAFTHLEHMQLEPRTVQFSQRLASFGRLIRFDKRGTGLSDRVVAIPTLEQRMDDVRAVMDAVDPNAPRLSASPRAVRCRCCRGSSRHS